MRGGGGETGGGRGAMRAGAGALLATLALALPVPGGAQAWLDQADRALSVASADGRLRADLSGLADLEGYWIDERPPGLIFGGDDPFVNPRLSLFVDARAGSRLYGFVQFRVDRGFDPRSRSSAARFDEYLVRWTPFADTRLRLQAGKFATVLGNWVARHDSWRNPFVTAPLPYENVTTVSDATVAPDRASQLARRDLDDRKNIWVPIIWGPAYTSGAAAFGTRGTVDWAVELKNAAPSSRPAVWDARSRNWRDPTVGGRLGWRPATAWQLGVSASHGAYLRRKVASALTGDREPDKFTQSLLGLDATFARRHLELWAEGFLARFEVPNVGNLDTAAYYVEGRYKLTPALFAALRWNQQFFEDLDGDGRSRTWDRDAWRLDLAVGYRFTRHLQAKLQYGLTQQRGGPQQGEQLLAAQATVKF